VSIFCVAKFGQTKIANLGLKSHEAFHILRPIFFFHETKIYQVIHHVFITKCYKVSVGTCVEIE